MTWWSSRRASRTSSTWALEELVALAELRELLQGQGVDRPEGGQLGLQLLDSGGRVDALGQLRGRGGQGLLRRAGQLVAQRLDHRLPPDGGLDQVQLDLLQPAPRRGQLVLAGRPLATELLQAGARRPGPPPAGSR